MEDDHTHHSHDHDGGGHPHPLFTSAYRLDFLFNDELVLGPVLREELAGDFGAEVGGDALSLSFEYDGAPFRAELQPVSADPDAIAQSWNWREARAVVPFCQFALSITDSSSVDQPWRARLNRVRSVAAAFLRRLEPQAVYAPHSQQYLDPAVLREAFNEAGGDELFGFLNIRLFRVDGTDRGLYAEDDSVVMDTLGLSALGLPDLQAHFRTLDRSKVAEFLYATANYIFEEGAVIDSGHELAGFVPDHKWSCRLDESLVAPARLVIDLDPGKPFSVGE